MRRKFYEEVLYDYSTNAEAVRHCKEMMAKDWMPFSKSGEYEAVVFYNGQEDMPYSCWYRKQH